MSGYFWLITEMLLLLTLAAVVFFLLGWRWRGRRSLLQTAALEQRLDEVTRTSHEPAAPGMPPSSAPTNAALKAELSDSQARQLTLERELVRLRDAKLDAERQLREAAQYQNAAPAPAPPPPSPTADSPDDLTRLRGAGPVICGKLRAAGITTFRQLAALSQEELSVLDDTLKLSGRAIRFGWQEQARALQEETCGSAP